MKVLFVVVVYKKALVQSPTLKSILSVKEHIEGSSVLVFDNSPSPQSNLELEYFFKEFSMAGVSFIYESYIENRSLSKLYNQAIELLQHSHHDYICLLDHDTTFDMGLIDEVKLVVPFEKPNLMLPRIFFKQRLVSPTKRIFIKGFYLKRLKSGFYRSRYFQLSAINSGMFISSDYLNTTGFRYDERLDFYGTDDYFMIRFAESGHVPFVLDYEMQHDLTLSTLNANSDSLVIAYRKMVASWRIIYSEKSFFVKGIASLYAIAHNLFMFFRYKDKRFLCFLKK